MHMLLPRMKKAVLPFLTLLIFWSCSENPDKRQSHDDAATVASETGRRIPLPDDVMYATKPLIGGQVYSHPDFRSQTVAYFDTSQQIHVLDASDAMFVKARIQQDTSSYTGYVTKTILPERKK